MTVEQIQPFVAALDMICVETAAPPTVMVVFGASGDLAQRKLLPGLVQIQTRGLLSDHFCLLGCGRTPYSDEQFRQVVRETFEAQGENTSAAAIADLLERVYYVSGDYGDPATYESIKSRLAELRQRHGMRGCSLFYLSVPPFLYETIIEHLGSSGLSRKDQPECQLQARLVVEKPFGRDLKTATELNDTIAKWFNERQVYRIDHYLGKETV